jgi:hypothetical protein
MAQEEQYQKRVNTTLRGIVKKKFCYDVVLKDVKEAELARRIIREYYENYTPVGFTTEKSLPPSEEKS